MAYQQNNGSMPPAHGGNHQPGQSYDGTAQEQTYTSSPAAHGGNHQPGQSRSYDGAAQEQDHSQPYASSNSPPATQAHGGNHQPGQPNQPRKPVPAYPQPVRQQQQQAYIPEPIQPVSYNQPVSYSLPYQNQNSQQQYTLNKEPFMVAALELGGAIGVADTVARPGPHRRRTFQKGYSNISHHKASLRWKYPHSYQLPGLSFISTVIARHRDEMQRVWKGTESDRYVSPWDGHLAKLVVQSTQDIYDGAQNSTWRRTFIRNASPIYIQLANFPFNHLPTNTSDWTGNDLAMVALKWFPTCAGLLCVLLWQPNAAEGQWRNNGFYDPFLYRYWGYPKAARNFYESPSSVDHLPHAGTNSNSLLMQRVLGPRYLCFLNEPSESKMCGVTVRRVDQSTINTPYVFIAYTAEQFEEEDYVDLDNIAERAAREAGVPAYWIGCSCMQDEDQVEDDVYRISDVIRGAKSLVIAVGPSRKRPGLKTSDEMLKMWGERMWTLPEALLSPADKDITVYVRGNSGLPRVISKKQFAATVWDDPLISRQLVDHYNKTLDLTPLELVPIALSCLGSRNTTQYLSGDLSYALMGLLRQRPQIDKTDSDFQAFARLSLANDSDMLLERLICMLPKNQNASWLAMDDAWNANLWDVYPRCQVAGVGHDNTVILDGAFGASIRWKAFAPVADIRRDLWKRFGSRIVIHGAPLYFIIACYLIASSRPNHETGRPTNTTYLGVGAFLLLLCLPVILFSPYLLRVIYSGKLWMTQAWFFGFEGYLDLATIESHIFGAYMGRLKWSPYGSSISKHHMNEHGECIGVDPTLDPHVRELVEQARNANYGELKVFTLVDTYTLTVTMFLAVRPPVAVLMCGHEGGMQRAVMCSYDWASQTLYRESVLRMETVVLERMSRVRRFRFGLQRPLSEVQ